MIDLSKMKYDHVYMLYPAMVSRHIKAAEELAKDAEGAPSGLNEQLAKNELAARADLQTLENYFKNHVANNLDWAQNEVYARLGLNKYMQVQFHPATDSYKNYGPYAGGSLACTPEDLATVIIESAQNNGARIEGNILFDANDPNTLNEEQKQKLKIEGFHCRDIYSIQAVGAF